MCAIFWKMIRMAQNVCKMNFRRFGAFWMFARALTRGRTRTRAFMYMYLTEIKLTFIMTSLNEKWLSIMKIWQWLDFYKMAPRLRNQWRSRLKIFGCLVLTYVHVCAKFQDVSCSHVHVIVTTKKGGEIRKIIITRTILVYTSIRWSVFCDSV